MLGQGWAVVFLGAVVSAVECIVVVVLAMACAGLHSGKKLRYNALLPSQSCNMRFSGEGHEMRPHCPQGFQSHRKACQ